MADTRSVIIAEVAVRRAEKYRDARASKTGIRLSLGAVFAEALDKLIQQDSRN